MAKRLELKVFFLIFGLALLVFFAETRSFHLLVDGLTYAGLAKNILRTGDWRTLHYSVETYQNFYQQLPLAIWMQALVYKAFGFSEPISRLLPGTFALLSVFAVYAFSRLRYGIPAAFWSALVLITSTRFVKWGTNFYLDGIFGFFCFASFALLLWTFSSHPKKLYVRSELFSFASGVLLACAFLTKGMMAFGVFSVSVFSIFFFFSPANLINLFFYGVGIAAPLAFWFQYGDGYTYLQNYFLGSIVPQIQTHEINSGPWKNLFTIWWPWLPVFFFAIYQGVKELAQKKPAKFLLSLAALTFPIGLSFIQGYGEHNLTPFYLFGSGLVGVQIAQWSKGITERAIHFSYGILLMVALFVATVAPSFHEVKPNAAGKWVQELETLSPEKQLAIKQVAFTEKASDFTLALANVIGKTDWQAIGNFALSRDTIPGTILVTEKNEVPAKTWIFVPCLQIEGFRLYRAADLDLCH